MKILIFSDTHGNSEDAIEVIRKEPEVNAIIHSGDCETDADKIRSTFPNIPIYSVPGNCDISSFSPEDMVISLEGKKVLITHGHKYNVKYGLTSLKNKTLYEEFDMVIFGHTHISMIEYFGKAVIINPGTLKGHNKSYAKAEITNGVIKASIIDL